MAPETAELGIVCVESRALSYANCKHRTLPCKLVRGNLQRDSGNHWFSVLGNI